jgi:cell shape-determining protein MreD
MKSVNTLLILVTAFLAVFLQSLFAGLRDWLGTQINLLPALIVVAALHGGLRSVALLSVCGGLWFDSLSANPLGVSILPLFAIGYTIYQQRELILRDLVFAQFIIGLAASLAAPVLTLLLLFSMGLSPLTGWGTLWQLLVMGVVGGGLTPLCFRFFRFVRRAFFHPPMTQPSFREDREIRRGRI